MMMLLLILAIKLFVNTLPILFLDLFPELIVLMQLETHKEYFDEIEGLWYGVAQLVFG